MKGQGLGVGFWVWGGGGGGGRSHVRDSVSFGYVGLLPWGLVLV